MLVPRLQMFSPVALASAAVIAATGTFAAWLHLPRTADLWTTPYGRLLSIKLLVFASIIAFGAHNWRRATPRMGASGDARAIRRTILAELIATGILILVTAWFVATSPPEAGG
jgi:putative copper export protein